MSIQTVLRTDEYWIVEDEFGYGPAFVLRTSWQSRYSDIMSRYNARIIRLNEYMGWPDSDVGFLTELPHLHGVTILSSRVSDVSPVFQMTSLKKISLTCPAKKAGNFGSFGALESVFLTWRNLYDSIFDLERLKRVNIDGYPERDLTRWKPNRKSKFLGLSSTRLESLSGMDRFSNITELRLYACRRLNSLDAVSCAGSIQSLGLNKCPCVRDLSPVSNLVNLKELEIEDCKEILSLAPVAKCKKLELLQVAGNTNVLDGDFSPLKTLPKLKRVLLAQRKHYSHSAEDLENA
jgi:hypothetical protein